MRQLQIHAIVNSKRFYLRWPARILLITTLVALNNFAQIAAPEEAKAAPIPATWNLVAAGERTAVFGFKNYVSCANSSTVTNLSK